VKALTPAKARVLAIVATLLCLIYAGIVFYGGWIYVAKMYEIGILAQDIPIPQWVPRLVLPLGYALLFFRFSQVLYRLLTGEEVHLLVDEAEDALKHGHEGGEPRENKAP